MSPSNNSDLIIYSVAILPDLIRLMSYNDPDIIYIQGPGT